MLFSMKFLSFTIIDPNLAENLTKLAEIVGPHVVYGVAFSNSKDPWSLVGPGCHQVSSGVVVRIVEGKSRVEALLNTGRYHGWCQYHKSLSIGSKCFVFFYGQEKQRKVNTVNNCQYGQNWTKTGQKRSGGTRRQADRHINTLTRTDLSAGPRE